MYETTAPDPSVFSVVAHYGLWTIGIIAFLIVLNLIFGPRYAVWAAHMSGKADLAKAMNDQQIQVAEAKSRLAAAEANKQAAIVEASAVAEQIKIIGDNVKEHPLYLTWQWIKMMEDREGTTIYVPTEANLPILEAGKRLA